MKGNLDPKFDYIRRKAPEIAIPTEKRIKQQKEVNRLGPGEYDIAQPKIKNIAVDKNVRFKAQTEDEKMPLFPNHEAIE